METEIQAPAVRLPTDGLAQGENSPLEASLSPRVSGTRHIPPHMQTQIWLSSTWFGVHTGANMGTQAALQARCHFRETLENPRAQ